MEAYNTVVDAANPHGGLFTVLQKLEAETERKAVYEILQHATDATSTSAEYEQRWTSSTKKGTELLPKLAFVSCATAFEAFVSNTIICCLDTVFSTRKVINTEEEFWKSEFNSWLNKRVNDSEFWAKKEHEDENKFWIEFPDLGVKSSGEMQHENKNAILHNLSLQWDKIFQYLLKNPTTQEAVGLVQEMVNNKKQNIMGTLKSPTMEHIQETFTRFVLEASNGRGTRKRKGDSAVKPQPKTKRKHETPQQSPSTSGSFISNVSADISQSSSSTSITTPTSESSKAQHPVPIDTSTPLPLTESSKTNTETNVAIDYLLTHYASKYDWQIWPDGASRKVKCKNAESLSYLSNLFYGMRCIFSHGRPERTLEFGAMRVDRTPHKSSDFNIRVLRCGTWEEECTETKKLCEDYLFNVLTEAKDSGSQMTMDYNLFLTAQSFYAYAVEIIGSVAACVAYKYSDVKLSERATEVEKQKIKEIKDTNDYAWKCSATEASSIFQLSRRDPIMDVDDFSVLETEQTAALAAPSTGITRDAWKRATSAASLISQPNPTMDVTDENVSVRETEQTTASAAPSTGLTPDIIELSLKKPYRS